jgi:SpoVK/Ycf46/Vps4 family AAA+-type ATPase
MTLVSAYSIRLIVLSNSYTCGKLIEINSHSLFSKWFSESGKLVQRLFLRINDLVDDSQTFVVVLIDEVESLTAARKASLDSNEPSDALRVCCLLWSRKHLDL